MFADVCGILRFNAPIVMLTAMLAPVTFHVPLALAQDQFLMPDRDADAVLRVRDINHDGVISDPGEVFAWFDAGNAAGTVGPMNPTAQAISVTRIVALGDQVNRNVYRLIDLNNDGDAQDVGESIVFADVTNASGVSFAFPTGAAFDSQCRLHIVNAGNAFGADGIYRLIDVNGDGDAQDAGEVMPFVTDGPSGFGAGNGPYAPQEMFFDAGAVAYVRNSSAGLHGIYRLFDSNHNFRADDAGEMTLFFGAGNQSGVAVGPGFALEPDRALPGAMYFQQVATGGIDQVFRVADLNDDHDAQDSDEGVLVYETAAAGFTLVDILSLQNGDLLLTDNSGITVVRLHDGNNNGNFMDKGESMLLIAGPGTVTQARQIDVLRRLGDVNASGNVDIDDLLSVIGAWGPADICTAADLDRDGDVDIDDLLALIGAWD